MTNLMTAYPVDLINRNRVISILAGLGMGLWAYFTAVESQLDTVANSLAESCRERSTAIESLITALRTSATTLAALVGSHNKYALSQKIFSQFIGQSSAVRSALTRATWVQRVYQNERAEWEARMSAEFGGNFTILEATSPGSLANIGNRVVSPVKPIYFPITYPGMCPSARHTDHSQISLIIDWMMVTDGFSNTTLQNQPPTVLVGIDTLTLFDQPWPYIINDVINSSTEIMTLSTRQGFARSTVAVYNTTLAPDATPEERQAHAMGVVILYWDLAETFNLALKSFVPQTDILFTIVDQISPVRTYPSVASLHFAAYALMVWYD
jgi:hypothetical protein